MKCFYRALTAFACSVLLVACGGGGGGGGQGPVINSFATSSASVSSSSASSLATSSSSLSTSKSSSSRSSSSSSAVSSSASSPAIQVNLQATTDANGKLDVSWTRATTGSYRFLSCEFHMNLDGNLPRVPVKSITDCAASDSFSLTEFPFFGGTLTMITYYLDNVGKKTITTNTTVVESPAGYTQPVIRALDLSQVVVKTNPKLVPDRDALLRVHVTAPAALVIPDVQLTMELDGATRVVSMSKPVSIPATRQFSSLNYAYLTLIDRAWMKPGLTLTINMGGSLRKVTPTFGPASILYLTLVPTTVLGMTSEVVDPAQVQIDVKTFWPLSDVKTRTRAGFTSKVTDISKLGDMLDELRDLHTIDQDPSHYYGFFSGNLKDLPFGGLGDKPGRDAIGLDYDNTNLMPHELGHNFDLGHVDCGGPEGIDPNYPYADASMGSLGINLYLNFLRQPDKYVDLMSYCSPKHTSDYSYENAQDYLARHPSQAFTTTLASPPPGQVAPRSLFISGNISAAGKVRIRRLVPMNRAAVENPISEYQLQITDSAGQVSDYFVEMPNIDHPSVAHEQYFSAIIPYADIRVLEVLHYGQVIYRDAQVAAAPVPGATAQSAPNPPVIVESAKQACLQWAVAMGTATLIHHGDLITTMAMDDSSGNLCVSTEALSTQGSWQIILRTGIAVQEFTQLR